MRPRPIRVRRPLPMALGLSLLALLAACSKPAPAPEPIRAVRTQKVSTESATAQQEYAGEIKARTETRLSFRVGGKLMSRAVNLGDEVKAGQVIAQLDPSDLKLGQDAAAAGLRAAQANWD